MRHPLTASFRLHCSYGHTIKQSRGPSYVAHLEKKVTELEERLKTTSCVSETGAGVARSASQSPKYDSTSTSQCSPTTSEWTGLPSAGPSMISDQFGFQGLDRMNLTGTNYVSTVMSEPRGKHFGIDVLRQLWNHCTTTKSSTTNQGLESSLKLVQALDVLPVDNFRGNGAPLLPAKAQLIRWIGIAFNEAFPLWPFLSRACIQMIVYRLYSTNTFGQDGNDEDDLALLYALLALGQRFDAAKNLSAAESRVQGLPYFVASQEIVPLQNCDRSLPALQTVLCLALFLKAGSALTRSHAYVSAAASASLRMGLHEQVPCFPKDEQVMMQRVWSTIRSLDVLISSSLGIPHIVSIAPYEEEPFPSLSVGFEEELVTSSAHVRLLGILSRALDRTYCSGSTRKSFGLGSFAVPEESLRESCSELEAWEQSCTSLATPIENMRRQALNPEDLRHFS